MAREWIDPATGTQILEDGTKEYIHPAVGAQIQEDQGAAPAGANPKGPLGMPLRGPFGGPI